MKYIKYFCTKTVASHYYVTQYPCSNHIMFSRQCLNDHIQFSLLKD